MTRTHGFFTSLLELDLGLNVEIHTHAKCVVKGVGTVRFQQELGGSLEVTDVLYVLELRMNLSLGINIRGQWIRHLF